MRVSWIGEGCWTHVLAEEPSSAMIPRSLGQVVGVESRGFNVCRPASCGDGYVITRLTFGERVFASQAEALLAGSCVSARAPRRHRTAWLETLDEV